MNIRRVLTASLPFLADPSAKFVTLLFLVATIAQVEKDDEPTVSEKPLAIKFSDLATPTELNFDPILSQVQTAAGTANVQATGLRQDENGNWKLTHHGGGVPFSG